MTKVDNYCADGKQVVHNKRTIKCIRVSTYRLIVLLGILPGCLFVVYVRT